MTYGQQPPNGAPPPGQWQPPNGGGAWGTPAPAAPQQPGYGGAPAPGYPQQGVAPAYPGAPMGYPGAGGPPPGYPGAPMGGGQPNYDANPFAGMTSGEQIRSYPFLGTLDKDGPPVKGAYKLRLQAIKYKKINSGTTHLIIEVLVTESNQVLRPAGMVCSIFIKQGTVMSGPNNVAFVAAVLGMNPTALPKDSTHAPWADQRVGRHMAWSEYANEAIQPENPWANREVGCFAEPIKTKAGDDHTRMDWTPIAEMVVPATPAPAPEQPPAPLPFNPGAMPGAFGPPPGAFGAPPPAGWQSAPGAPPVGPAGSWGQPPAPMGYPPQGQPPQQWQQPGQPPQLPPQQPQWQQPAQQQLPPQQQPGQMPPGSWGQPPNR